MSDWKWNDGIERWWNAYKHKMIQFIGGLMMEKNDEGHYVASLGRIAFWAVLIPALHIWVTGKGMLEGGTAISDISPNHLTVLLSLMGYNFGKKAIDMANSWKNGGAEVPPANEDGPG